MNDFILFSVFIASFIVVFLCFKKTCKNLYGIGVLRGYIYGYKSAIRKCPIENPDELLKKLSMKAIKHKKRDRKTDPGAGK